MTWCGIWNIPNEHLRFVSWILPWGAFSTTIVEIEAPSNECFLSSYAGLIGLTMVSSIIAFRLVSKESLQFIMSILFFSFSYSMTSWGLFFLADFLPRLRTFPITTMININIVYFCFSSITSFQTFNLLYNYWSFKVFQSSFSIVYISHQNNNEWENLPLVLLNNYISNKIIAYTRILFINSTLCHLF